MTSTLPEVQGIVSANYLYICCSKPKGFFHLLNKRFTADSNVLCPFFVDSLNRAVLEQNRSIKGDLETFLRHFLRNVNHLAWPDPLTNIHLLRQGDRQRLGNQILGCYSDDSLRYFEENYCFLRSRIWSDKCCVWFSYLASEPPPCRTSGEFNLTYYR